MTIEFSGVESVFYDHRKYTKSVFFLIGDNGSTKFPAEHVRSLHLHSKDKGIIILHGHEMRKGLAFKCTSARLVRCETPGTGFYDLHIDVAEEVTP